MPTKTKKLTIRQAWAFLAKKWGKPRRDKPAKEIFVSFGTKRSFGLCSSVGMLENSRMISDDTWTAMCEQIEAERKRLDTWFPFLWSLDREGAKRRTAFCRKMAGKKKAVTA